MTNPSLYSTETAAKTLGVSRRQFAKDVVAAGIEPKVFGKKHFFTPAQLEVLRERKAR